VTEPSCSASFTDFEAFLPLPSPFTSRRVAPPRRPLLSWPSAPLEFVPQPSEPRPLPTRRSRTDEAHGQARSLRRATTRTAALAAGWNLFTYRMKVNQLARQHPALFRTGPHHLSVATPSPLTFATTVSRRVGLRSFQVTESRRFSVEIRQPLLGFLTSSTTSKPQSPRRSWLMNSPKGRSLVSERS